ncbi:YccF domain-containing protein [Franconibacter helveticus 513]|uniref:YccF domain-containing protein n=1 Tax=Franconibacter helveticus TaxID=357240 RepID=UPI000405B175|nr:YccF domain-containing protein [Franconibacter helveticus]MDU6922877.1 YccF domain-containing protein [Franconibacter helveticus]
MRTVLNILNFVLGGFLTTLSWLLATLVSMVLIITLPLTRSCWEITKLSLVPYGNEAVHVDELNPGSKNAVLNAGGTLLNIIWLVLFGWWLCLLHITTGIAQCLTLIGIPVGIANFKIAAIALWPVGRRVVSVEMAQAAREANASRRFESK